MRKSFIVPRSVPITIVSYMQPLVAFCFYFISFPKAKSYFPICLSTSISSFTIQLTVYMSLFDVFFLFVLLWFLHSFMQKAFSFAFPFMKLASPHICFSVFTVIIPVYFLFFNVIGLVSVYIAQSLSTCCLKYFLFPRSLICKFFPILYSIPCHIVTFQPNLSVNLGQTIILSIDSDIFKVAFWLLFYSHFFFLLHWTTFQIY